MAVNLRATATLNIKPFMASLATLSKAHTKLNTSVATGGAAGNKASNDKTVREMAAREAAARVGVASAIDKQSAANARLAASQSSVAKGGAAASSGIAAQRYMFHDLARQMTVASAAMAAMPVIGIGVAASWQKSFADVVRTADPAFSALETRTQGLRSSLVQMVQAMPTSFTDVTAIATLANQMGIASEQVGEFTRSVAMFSATSGVSVDLTATAFGRLTSILGDNAIGFNEMADSILKVGVNSVATEAEIINITTQISSIAAQAGFTAEGMIALSGAMASVRVPPELSRGVITRTFGQIGRAISDGGDKLQNFARISGMTSKEFADSWGPGGDPEATLNNFLQGLRDLGPAAEQELRNLGITSVRDVPVLLRLSNAADSEGIVGGLFTQTLKDARNAAGETQRQYTIMAETVSAKFKVLGNNILAFFDAMGQSGLGPVGYIVDDISDRIRNLTRTLDDAIFSIGSFTITKGDLIGFFGVVAGGVAVFTALGAILAQVGAAAATFKQLGGVIGGLFGAKAITETAQMADGLGDVAVAASVAQGNTGKLSGTLRGLGKAAVVAGGVTAIFVVMAETAGFVERAVSKAGTSTEELAESLSKVSFDTGVLSGLADLDAIMASIEVHNRGISDNPNPFIGWWEGLTGSSQAIGSLQEYKDILDDMANSRTIEGMIAHVEGLRGEADVTRWERLVNVTEKFGGALDDMVDAGNGQRAMSILRELGLTAEQFAIQMEQAPELKGFMSNLLETSDIKATDDNLRRLAMGGFQDVINAAYGIKNFDGLFEDFAPDAEDAAQATGDFASAINAAAREFVDLKTITDAATNEDGVFSLDTFMQGMRDGLAAQEEWSSNLKKLAETGSKEFIQALAEEGPAMADAVAAFVSNPEAFAEAQAMYEESTSDLVGGMVASFISAKNWAQGALGGELTDLLKEALNEGEFEQVYAAAKGVGSDTAQSIIEGFIAGEYDLETTLNKLLAASEIDVFVGLDTREANRQAAAMKHALENTFDIEIPADVRVDPYTSLGELRDILGRPGMFPDIPADISLTEAYNTVDGFAAWARATGIEMLINGDIDPAMYSLEVLKGIGDRTISTIQLDALPTLAEGHIYDVVQLADGSTGFITIDGHNKLALDSVTVVDEATGETRVIPLDADTVEALNKARSFTTEATRPLTVPIDADTSEATRKKNALAGPTSSRHTIYAQVVKNYTARDLDPGNVYGRANGGIDFFAEGGVRENHIAQIAPAGAMRVWAEPETGGEAYIPLSPTKRLRSTAILQNVASRFGYSLAPQNYTKFADGGTYLAQQQSRAINSNSVGRGVGRSYEKATNFNMTIVNPETRDPIKQAWDQSELWGNFSNV